MMKETKQTLRLCAFGLILFINTSLFAQGSKSQPALYSAKNTPFDEIKPLSIGDKVPDLIFSSTLNYTYPTARLSDFKGKYIILDFWATWCSSCLHHFPQMDSLQKQFGNQLQILLINTVNTYDNEAKVKMFFEKWKRRNGPDFVLPFIIKDSITEKLFPHKELPHYIWIDNNNIIKAVTTADEITAENIKAMIDGVALQLPLKKDNLDFNFQKPLFINGNGGNGENIKYRLTITGYNEGLPGMSGITMGEDRLVSRIYCFNSPIIRLYKHAFPKIRDYPINRIILNVKDPSRYYKAGKWGNWINENTYVYELIVSPTPLQNIQRQMRDDLDKYFGLTTLIQKRKVKCLVMKRISFSINISSNAQESETNLYENDNKTKFIEKMPIIILINRLNELFTIPVLDETNFTSEVDMQLPANLSNLEDLKVALKKYGFDLVSQERELEMFVITENVYNNKQRK